MAPPRRDGRSRYQHRDEHAAKLIWEFLDERGWSALRLAQETERVARERDKPELTASRRTIDRVLQDDLVPTARVKAAISLVMGVPPWMVWGKGQMPLAYQRQQMTLMGAAR